MENRYNKFAIPIPCSCSPKLKPVNVINLTNHQADRLDQPVYPTLKIITAIHQLNEEGYDAVIAKLETGIPGIKHFLHPLSGGKTDDVSMKRLMFASERLKENKKDNISGQVNKEAEQARKLTLNTLTGCADQLLLTNGEHNIYEDTCQMTKYCTKQPRVDRFDDRKPNVGDGVPTNEGGAYQNQLAMWEYKWNLEDVEIFGPYSSDQMSKWVKAEYFKDGVWVRRIDKSDSPFYNSKRIDFQLYT